MKIPGTALRQTGDFEYFRHKETPRARLEHAGLFLYAACDCWPNRA
ncbi:hypothetical protein ROTO_31890 [Roseovarius tolerans]|uniref:Uncharacterized protein n=1 Tax=Roseovarius tolerans TaxID=74031 RepID=A0A0L6CRT7_9RHOB|nr:hypothetical protein ROTO_31890 [Roseovarius tolerans]